MTATLAPSPRKAAVPNMAAHHEKRAATPQVDVIYLAWNRLEYTRVTFPLLLKNTDWSLVRNLIVYEDGSTDGTRQYLDSMLAGAWHGDGGRTFKAHLSYLGFRSPVRTMLHYLGGDPAPLFAKIDSDIACPPGWLNELAAVMDASPELELLGMQAGMTTEPMAGVVRGWQPCSHIGGVGLMRTSAFLFRPPMRAAGRFGFTDWQQREDPVRGWIVPDLPCPQLDLLPQRSWRELADAYVTLGWQRPWPPYDPDATWIWDWFKP